MFMSAKEALKLTKEYEYKEITNLIMEAVNRGKCQLIIGNGMEAFKIMSDKIANQLRESGYKVNFNSKDYPIDIEGASHKNVVYNVAEWSISWEDTTSSL